MEIYHAFPVLFRFDIPAYAHPQGGVTLAYCTRTDVMRTLSRHGLWDAFLRIIPNPHGDVFRARDTDIALGELLHG